MGSENVFQENQEYLIKARELVVAIDDVQDNLEQARTAQEKEETAAGMAGVTGSYRTYMKQKEQKKGGVISYVMSAAMLLVICGLGVTAYQNHTKMNDMEAAILQMNHGQVEATETAGQVREILCQSRGRKQLHRKMYRRQKWQRRIRQCRQRREARQKQ